MRTRVRMTVTALTLLLLALGTGLLLSSGSNQTPLFSTDSGPGFLIRFGLRDNTPSVWNGSVQGGRGEIARIQGWRFEDSDQLNLTEMSWQLKTAYLPFNTPQRYNAPQNPDIVQKGILLELTPQVSGPVVVNTEKGSFQFRPHDVGSDQKLYFLDGGVSVETVQLSNRITDESHNDDYYSTVLDSDGNLWIGWISYKAGRDRVLARYQTSQGNWSKTHVVSDWGDHYQTSLISDREGKIWLIWSAQVEGNWDLYGRNFDSRDWSETFRITEAAQPDLFPRTTRLQDGTVALCWQGFRDGQSDILFTMLRDGKWAPEVRISESKANDWQPSIASKGRTIWIAWDTYANGTYDVMLREVEDGTPGRTTQVAATPLFEAHASVAIDREGFPWVAWEESGMNWGKDWARDDVFRSTLLYFWRHSNLARIGPDGVNTCSPALEQALPKGLRRYQQLPQPVFDDNGNLWVFFRVRTSTLRDRYDGWAAGGRWESYVTRLENGSWLPALYLSDSVGKIETPISAVSSRGRLRLVWSSDQRPFRLRGGSGPNLYGNTSLFTSVLDTSGIIPENPGLSVPPFGGNPTPVHPNEENDLERIRAYRMTTGGQTLQIYRGDLHRHTEISYDGAGDGSLLDLYRYALDAASLDFILVGDHNMGNDDEYSWWRTQKSNDLFAVSKAFVPLYGYERSVSFPNGHRNLIFAERGIRTLPIGREEQRGNINTGDVLYPHLSKNSGIATSHSTASSQGTDWRDSDENLEPVVELYQAYHASYEYEGAPKAESDRFQAKVHGRFEAAGFWWEALKKGIRLGVQASSDHLATHTSYACVYAPDSSRSSLIEAMRARHTYAATDNIILDFRAKGPDGEKMMGDAFATSEKPRFMISVQGTDSIRELALIRNGEFLLTLRPNKPKVELTHVDTDPVEGQEVWYYVRVLQDDRQMAWSSPIWITVD